MTVDLIEQYRRWFDYEKDSHAKVLDSLLSVGARLTVRPEFQKAVDLLAHVAAARWLWLHRLGVLANGPPNVFPKGVKVTDLETALSEMHDTWSAYLATLSAPQIERSFEYQSLEGATYRNRVRDILTQLYGHSLYHRGQIALLLRSIGAQPAETDLV